MSQYNVYDILSNYTKPLIVYLLKNENIAKHDSDIFRNPLFILFIITSTTYRPKPVASSIVRPHRRSKQSYYIAILHAHRDRIRDASSSSSPHHHYSNKYAIFSCLMLNCISNAQNLPGKLTEQVRHIRTNIPSASIFKKNCSLLT